VKTTAEVTNLLANQKFQLEVGQNVSLNLEPYIELGKINSLDHDLLRLAAYVFAADLAVKRCEREQHLRSIALEVPITNIQAFERVHDLLEQALSTLSADNWTLKFTPTTGVSPAHNPQWPKKENSTLLFSGGLDSFAGAVELLNSQTAITLVSHVTHNWPVKTSQAKLAKAVRAFTHREIQHLQVSVFCRTHGKFPFPADTDREDTQRTRSFLFTALAAVAARLSGSRRMVVMAENGQFAIHLPLTEARIGSFSTHTAHPKFLAEMQEILRQVFVCNDLEVVNPFVYRTKGEVVALIPQGLHPSIVDSASCWRGSRVATYTHCGACIPCLCRRIALETHGVKLPEFERDLLSENIGALKPDDLGKRNLLDLCQFIMLFSGSRKIVSDQELCIEFPDLFDTNLDQTKAIQMYRRFADEALAVFKAYPKLKVLLK